MSQEVTNAADTASTTAAPDTASLADAAEQDDALVGLDEVGELRAQLEEANRRADEMNGAFLRARADYANLKRRTDEERESMRSLMNADLLSRLLPIIDNFERALKAAEQTRDYDKLIGGVNAVYRQMQDFLTREGVMPIDAADQPFDPNLHNAVLREETAEHPENTVLEELQRGYVLNGKVLRPAMVKVAAGGS